MLLILNILKVLAGSVFNKLYPFLILNMVAITVGGESVGGYAMFISVSGTAAIFITGGVGPILVRYLAAPEEANFISKQKVFDFSISVSTAIIIFLSAGIYFLGDKLFSFEVSDVSAELFSILVIIFLVGQSVVSLAKSALIGLRRYSFLMVYEFVLTIISLSGLVFAFIFFGFSSLKVYLFVSAILSAVNGCLSFLLIFRIRRSVGQESELGLNSIKIKRLFGFGVPSLVNALMFAPVLLIGKFVLESTHGLAAVGQFELAFQWATMVLVVTGVVSSLALPELSVHLRDKEKFKLIYFQYIIVNVVISVSLGFLLVFFFYLNRSGILDFFSVVHQIEYNLLFMALITSILISVWSVQTKVCAAYEKQFWVTKLNLVWALVCGSLVVFFVPKYGVLGLMVSVTVSWLFLVIIFIWFNGRIFGSKDEILFI